MPFLNFQILEDGKPDRLNPPLFRSSGSTHTHTPYSGDALDTETGMCFKPTNKVGWRI